jgi:hypothetical protein
MRQKLLRLLLAGSLLACLPCATPAQSLSKSKEKTPSAVEAKKRIEKIGVGVAAHVRLTLRDGTKMEGYVGQAGEDHFYLVRTDEKSRTATIVAYANIAQLKGKRAPLDWRNIHTGPGFGANLIVRLLQNLGAPETGH